MFVCIEIPKELFDKLKLIAKAHNAYEVNGYNSIRIGFMEFGSWKVKNKRLELATFE